MINFKNLFFIILSFSLSMNAGPESILAWLGPETSELYDGDLHIPKIDTFPIILNGSSRLITETLIGNGLIKIEHGSSIIIAKKFLFTGTIDCEGELIIYTNTPLADIKITQKGKGKIWLQQRLSSKL